MMLRDSCDDMGLAEKPAGIGGKFQTAKKFFGIYRKTTLLYKQKCMILP